MYALVDCNNFFVSCERLFRPDLQNMPTIVLSSNDGCAVSRSNEAKALGVQMGEPLHILKQRFNVIPGAETTPSAIYALHRQWHAYQNVQSIVSVRPPLVVYSSNFELYGDISERLTTLLTSITPEIEVYSVDESFLELSDLAIADYEAWGRVVRKRILQYIGIPVSIGVAPTKTLCKLANHYAKKHRQDSGAYYLPIENGVGDARDIRRYVAIEDVWGVGRKLGPKLRVEGIATALDLANIRPQYAQQLMGIVGRRMVTELRGTPCLPLNGFTKPQHAISRGRQFGKDTSDITVIEAAVASMGDRATTMLRRQHQRAHSAGVWLGTNRRKPNYESLVCRVQFRTPTNDAGEICSRLAVELASRVNPCAQYHKAEVFLYDLVNENDIQTDIFGEVSPQHMQKSVRRLRALDAIRNNHGHHAIQYASQKLSNAWVPRKALISQRYTSQWSELPDARLC
jgi:DNA polymerase V